MSKRWAMVYVSSDEKLVHFTQSIASRGNIQSHWIKSMYTRARFTIKTCHVSFCSSLLVTFQRRTLDVWREMCATIRAHSRLLSRENTVHNGGPRQTPMIHRKSQSLSLPNFADVYRAWPSDCCGIIEGLSSSCNAFWDGTTSPRPMGLFDLRFWREWTGTI